MKARGSRGLIWPTGPVKIEIAGKTFNAVIEPPPIECAVAWYGHLHVYRGPADQLQAWCRAIDQQGSE